MIAASTIGKYDDADYQLFQQKVLNRTGIRLQDYKAEQMRRRIASMSSSVGCKSFVEFYTAMERDTALLGKFLDGMTINVTELLRNPDRFADLTKVVLPPMLKQRAGLPLSVWSAGCSYGAEAYTVAMLLEEMAPHLNHRVKGTDVDLTVLARADSAHFSEADMANISKARRDRFFVDPGTGSFLPSMALRRIVDFSRHDLLADPYPTASYDIAICRNVLIYFTEEAKERIYRGFFRSLRPGGVLFVGGTERLSDHRAIGFELIMPFFYRKPM
jgi:chemotaxis protein methyltransferase CheR